VHFPTENTLCLLVFFCAALNDGSKTLARRRLTNFCLNLRVFNRWKRLYTRQAVSFQTVEFWKNKLGAAVQNFILGVRVSERPKTLLILRVYHKNRRVARTSLDETEIPPYLTCRI